MHKMQAGEVINCIEGAESENRKVLHERFLFSQTFAQIDPWADLTSSDAKQQEFKPLIKVA